MNKSVLFLTNAYPDFDGSYRGGFIKKMAIFLQGDGYKVSVVTPKIYRKSRYYEEQHGIRVYRFPFWARDKLLIEYRKVPYLKMILYYVTGTLLTLFVMIRNRCDLIHVHWAIPTGMIGLVGRGILRKPLIVTIHGSDFKWATDGPAFVRKVFLYVTASAERLTCVSTVIEKELVLLGIQGDKISTFPMGVDERFLEAGRNRSPRSRTSDLSILSNRNLLPNYSVFTLIRAIPVVLNEEPGVRFLIAGEGAERDRLESEAKALSIGSAVEFLGRVANETMPDLLAQAEIYVSTSLYDGTSVSLLEAMAAGTFPIVTDIASNREWIRDGENGLLIPLGDEKTLAKKIIEAMRNPEARREAGQKNQRVVEERALWKQSMEKIREVYRRASG
jgi:glycosyltransferase involved in cell wall biosynthesis